MRRLCLDIGTHKFAAIEVDEQNNIVNYALKQHQFSILKDGQVENVPMAAKELRSFLEKYNFDLNLPALIAVAGKSMVVKTVEGRKHIFSDFVTEHDVETLLAEITEKASLEGYLLSDYDIVQWTLDDMIVENPIGRHGQLLKVKVVLQFFRKDTVLSLINTVKEAGLNIISIYSEAVASKEASVRQELRYFNIALVDIGAGTSDITVFKEGRVYNFASINMAGQFITQYIAQKFMVPLDVAEKIKVKPSNAKKVKNIVGKQISIDIAKVTDAISEAASTLAVNLAEQILKANDDKSPSAVALVGGGSLTPKLDEFLAQALDISPEMVHVAKLEAKGELSKPTWAVALGLAYLDVKRDIIRISLNGSSVFFLNTEHPTVQSALARSGLNIEQLLSRKPKVINVLLGHDNQEIILYEQNDVVPYVNGSKSNWEALLHDGDVLTFHITERTVKMDLCCIVEGSMRQKVNLSLVDENGKPISDPVEGHSYRLSPATKSELENMLSIKEQRFVRLKGPEIIAPGTLYKKIDFTFVNVTVDSSEPIKVPVDERETIADLLAFLMDKGLIQSKSLHISDGKREIGFSELASNFFDVFIAYDKNHG